MDGFAMSDSEGRSGTVSERQRFELLGKLGWLWMQSPLHRVWTMELAARFLLPPISLNQIAVIEREGLPVAYCSWAWLSAQAEVRYMLNPADIEVADWASGDRLWFADWVAPFGAADSWALRSLMAARFPDEVARAIRVKPGSKMARIMEFKGPRVQTEAGRERLRRYYEGFLRAARAIAPGDGVGDRDLPPTPDAGQLPDKHRASRRDAPSMTAAVGEGFAERR